MTDDLHGAVRRWPSLGLRAGALPWRVTAGAAEFLLIRRRNEAGADWAIPKGRLLAFREIGETARLEAYQEAGVHGRLGDSPIGSFIHLKRSALLGRRSDAVEVIVFPLEVASQESHWPEMDVRERRWAGADELPALIANDKLRELITAFVADQEVAAA